MTIAITRTDLTPREMELLRFIAARKTPPSYPEMMDAMGVSGKGSITMLLGGLERKGAIRRKAGAFRGITVVRSAICQPQREAVALPWWAESLRALRVGRGWSQEWLAKAAGCHINTIANIENGRNEPTIGMYGRLVSLLGADLDVLASVRSGRCA